MCDVRIDICGHVCLCNIHVMFAIVSNLKLLQTVYNLYVVPSGILADKWEAEKKDGQMCFFFFRGKRTVQIIQFVYLR